MRLAFWRRDEMPDFPPGFDDPIPYGGMGLSSPFLVAPRVRKLQERLRERGHEVELTGAYHEQTAAAVTEAKRKLRLAIPADTEDRATPELLGGLRL